MSEESVDRVLGCPQLTAEAVFAEERNSSGLAIHLPTLPGDPDIEVQKTWCVRERGDDFALNRNRMGGDLVIKSLAQRDRVARGTVLGLRISSGIEPNTHGIHEVEASRIDKDLLDTLPFATKENRGSENSLEGRFDPAVLASILWQVKIVEQLGWALEMNDAALLFDGQSGQPNRDEAILSVRQTEPRMSGDLKNQFSVAPGVDELVWGRPAKRKSAQHKWPRVKGDLLLIILPLLADEVDAIEVL